MSANLSFSQTRKESKHEGRDSGREQSFSAVNQKLIRAE